MICEIRTTRATYCVVVRGQCRGAFTVTASGAGTAGTARTTASRCIPGPALSDDATSELQGWVCSYATSARQAVVRSFESRSWACIRLHPHAVQQEHISIRSNLLARVCPLPCWLLLMQTRRRLLMTQSSHSSATCSTQDRGKRDAGCSGEPATGAHSKMHTSS